MEKKKSLLLPVSVGVGLTLLVAVIALTDVFYPLINYIHENSITPLGGVLCIILAVVWIVCVYNILTRLGNNMLPDKDQ